MKAHRLVVEYLATQAEVIASRADDVRVDAPDAVHRSRVATRRARSSLRTFGGLFRSAPVTSLRAELAWHADHLGAPRDAEVLRDRLLAALPELPQGKVTRPARARLTSSLSASHERGHAALVTTMDTARYAALRHDLARFVTEPPVKSAEADVNVTALPALLDKAIRRVRRLEARAVETGDDPHRWHEVRKAAKAARYCSELLVPAYAEPAIEWAAAWEAVTEAFGEFQDTVVAEAYLAGEAARARQAHESAETFLALIGLEHGRRDQAFARGREALTRALSSSTALPALNT